MTTQKTNIDCDKSTQQDFKRIEKLKKKAFLPQEIVYFLAKILEIPRPQLQKKIKLDSFHFSLEDREKHRAGQSLFTRAELYNYKSFDKAKSYLKDIMSIDFSLLKIKEKSEFLQSFAQIQEILEKDKKFADSMLDAFLYEKEEFYIQLAEKSSSFSFLAYFLAYFVFLPFFKHTRTQAENWKLLSLDSKEQENLSNNISISTDEEKEIQASRAKNEEFIWRHGHCPYCGSAPLLSYLKDKEGKRIHACSLCLALYRVPRIQCPFCLEEDQHSFKYFTTDTDPDYQIALCKKCSNYIKIVNYTEKASFNPSVLLDDFESLTLDIIALEQNFSQAVLSLWLC